MTLRLKPKSLSSSAVAKQPRSPSDKSKKRMAAKAGKGGNDRHSLQF